MDTVTAMERKLMLWTKTYPILPHSDIHSHILPGVDDGFRTCSDSVKAIEKMAAAGVEQFVLTPHINPDVDPDLEEARIREVYYAFRETLPHSLDVSLAAEYMIVKDFEKRAGNPELLCYADGSILVEMSYYYPSPNLETAVFELVNVGKKPILAHPERYLYMVDELETFDKLVESGVRLQLNLMSLTGVYGEESVIIMKHLLSHGMYSFCATDLHSLHQLDTILSTPVHKQLRRLWKGAQRRLTESTIL